tara:strand:+ start:471 stop:845 length:375 start_codon:yes stop_codon:yes gene_type:complete
MANESNSIHITIDIDQDTDDLRVSAVPNFSSTMPQDQSSFYMSVINGLIGHLKSSPEGLAHYGHLLQELSRMRTLVDTYEDEDDDFDIGFEPDETFLEKLKINTEAKKINGSKSKVVDFKKKLI